MRHPAQVAAAEGVVGEVKSFSNPTFSTLADCLDGEVPFFADSEIGGLLTWSNTNDVKGMEITRSELELSPATRTTPRP